MGSSSCWFSGIWFSNFPNAPNTEKEIWLYPKMASWLGKHLRKIEDLKLWVICSLSLLFFYMLFVWPMANCWLLLRKQSQSPDVNHCIWAIKFWFKSELEGWVSTLNWVASELWLQWHNALSHTLQIAVNTLPRLSPRFSNMWKCPQYSKQL